ncbi:hypothetical protein ACRJ4W_15315 [Streptomyces sp. GLT-R25]
MSDSILVRVTLDSYDFAHPSEEQTQVYVQIPDVARVSYMLPGSCFEGLKDRAWPEVLDVAQEHYAQAWVIDPSSAVARQAVMEWLRDPTNRDEMQAAYEEDQARRHPVVQSLRSSVAELKKANEGLNDLRVRALDKNAQLRDRIAQLESASRSTEAYDGELTMFRGLVRLLRVAARNGDLAEMQRLLYEHDAEERAAYSEAREKSSRQADATSSPREQRLAQLLDTIRTHRGEWRAGDVQVLRRLTGGPTKRSTARRDLAELHRRGHLNQHGPQDGRFYTLKRKRTRGGDEK